MMKNLNVYEKAKSCIMRQMMSQNGGTMVIELIVFVCFVTTSLALSVAEACGWIHLPLSTPLIIIKTPIVIP